jgi:hypothetical protein
VKIRVDLWLNLSDFDSGSWTLSGGVLLRLAAYFQDGLVEFIPVVKIVQIHGVAWRGSVIGNAARAQNPLARGIIVVITAHRGVVLLDGLRGERLRVLLYPGFEFGIGRLVLLDVILYRLFIEPERGTGHRIEASADAGIARSEFTRRFKRDFLPEARKLENAEWTRNAGADQWDVGFAHNDVLSMNHQPSTSRINLHFTPAGVGER